MTPTTREVTTCTNCPAYSAEDTREEFCNLAERGDLRLFAHPPLWCPLRTAPVLVTLKVKP